MCLSAALLTHIKSKSILQLPGAGHPLDAPPYCSSVPLFAVVIAVAVQLFGGMMTAAATLLSGSSIGAGARPAWRGRRLLWLLVSTRMILPNSLPITIRPAGVVD